MSVGTFLICGFGLSILLYVAKRILDLIEYKIKLKRRMDLYKGDDDFWNCGEEKDQLMESVRDMNS